MPRLGAVIRTFGPAYLARYGASMLPSHRRALHALAACRTPAAGGHVQRCARCGYEHFTYHSCRHRSCPTCHGAATAAWTTAREGELLPVPYFHVVFTIPSELRPLVRAHQRPLLAALMASAAGALRALAADPHYLGGSLGILAVLHTWSQTLGYHPHVHCLVPGGALAPDGRTWCPARGTFLVPVRALAVGFRGRFLARLRATVPGVVVPPQVRHRPWVVYAKPTVQGTVRVLQYLARYVHRVAITDARLLAVDRTHVRFRYTDRRRQTTRTMSLPGVEFLRRFLQHVLPRGFHKVRYYGWWRPHATTLRARLQLTLGAAPPTGPLFPPRPPTTPAVCPQCAVGTLLAHRRLPRLQLPWASAPPP